MREFQKVINIVFGFGCNLNCKYCYEKNWYKGGYEFNPIILDYIIHQYKDSSPGDLVIRYFGGEPLLYWDKLKLCIETLKDYSFEQQIITNGTLLTEEMVEVFNDANMKINISHDGKKTLENRGFDILENERLYNLISKIKYLRFSCVCSNDNRIPDIEEYFKQKFPNKPYEIMFNKFLETDAAVNNYNEYEDAIAYLHDLHQYNFNHRTELKSRPKLGLYLCSDGTFRNHRSNNIVSYIDKDTLKLITIPGAYEKEMELSACEFNKCEYFKYCTYCRLHIDKTDYCKQFTKAVLDLYNNPYSGIEGITLYLGNKCNKNCDYCRDKLLPVKRPEANDDNINKFKEFISKLQYLQKITFVGGEPLVYFNYIKDIVNTYPDKQYSIITNAELLKDDYIFDFLKKHNFSIAVSHDGVNNRISKGYDVFDNPIITNRIRWFNMHNKLTIMTVITKDTSDLIKSLYYFKQYLPVMFNWRLMLVQGEDFSKDLPDNIVDQVMKFFKMYKLDKTIANCLLGELRSYTYSTKLKNTSIYMDLDMNIGLDPLDTTHPFSEENYTKYIASVKRNVDIPKCNDCSLKSRCKRNFSLCNPTIKDFRIELDAKLYQYLQELKFTSRKDFIKHLDQIVSGGVE